MYYSFCDMRYLPETLPAHKQRGKKNEDISIMFRVKSIIFSI